MIKIGILGASGRVGSLLIDDLQNDAEAILSVVYASNKLIKTLPKDIVVTNEMRVLFENSDVIIDFSKPEGTQALLNEVVEGKHKKPLIIATTGLNKDQQNLLFEASKITPILYATNMSLGIAVLNKLVFLASQTLRDFDIEILEQHHKHKIDSPSGTALTLGQFAANARNLNLDEIRISGRDGNIGARSKDEIAVMSLRGGDVVGRHTVGLYNDGEFLELSHTATSRHTFSQGAIKVAKWIFGKDAKLYSINDALGI